MTRQNVTDGPARDHDAQVPDLGGDGMVYSEASAAIDVERRVRALVAGSPRRPTASSSRTDCGGVDRPGCGEAARARGDDEAPFSSSKGQPDTHLDHFVVLAEGKLADLAPKAPFEEGAELQVRTPRGRRHDGTAAVGKLDGVGRLRRRGGLARRQAGEGAHRARARRRRLRDLVRRARQAGP